jgi:hypothetical protein
MHSLRNLGSECPSDWNLSTPDGTDKIYAPQQIAIIDSKRFSFVAGDLLLASG